MSNVFCTECGTRLDASSRFCANCGAAVKGPVQASDPVSVHVSATAAPAQQQVEEIHFATAPIDRPDVPHVTAAAQTIIHNNVAMVMPSKSVAVAFLLSLFFGPLGMLYATVGGAVAMFFITLVVALFTAGLGLLLTHPICVIWACVSTSNYNAALVANNRGSTA